MSPPPRHEGLLRRVRSSGVFIGVVSSLHERFGVVDEEVFFQLSVVRGRVPQIGGKLLVKAAYCPGQAVPWKVLKVQTLSNQPPGEAAGARSKGRRSDCLQCQGSAPAFSLFLLGRKEDKAVLIGGEWVPLLDGPNPEADPRVAFVRPVRVCRISPGLSLPVEGKVLWGRQRWPWWRCRRVRFAQFGYLQEGDESCREVVVVFLLEIWGCVVSLEQWEASGQLREEKGSSLPPSPEDKAAMVRLRHGLSCQGCSSDVPRGGFFCGRPRFGILEKARGLPSWQPLHFHLTRAFFYSCPISPSPAPAQPPPKEEAEELVGIEVATAGEEQERAKNKGKAEPKASPDELCVLSLEGSLLLLPEEEEEDPTEGSEQGGKAPCVQGEPGRSGTHCLRPMQHGELSPCHPPSPFRQPQELHPSTTLPLGALLAFIYFNWNFWGCLHCRDLERILLALGRWSPRMEQGGSPPTAIPKPAAPREAGVLGKRGVRAKRKPSTPDLIQFQAVKVAAAPCG
ncbi:LOW QUALITY PROTEIN: cell cycle and apoptosis regulator protein 2 [Mergus octosetaceus]